MLDIKEVLQQSARLSRAAAEKQIEQGNQDQQHRAPSVSSADGGNTPADVAGWGDAERLRKALEKCGTDAKSINVCIHAAEAGSLECLQLAHRSGCPLSSPAMFAAAARNHLSCLRYMHEQGMKWESIHAGTAASRGALNCLRYAVEHGCRLKARDITYHEAWDGLGHLRARAACLLYAHAQGCALQRRHWQSRVGECAAALLRERRREFMLCAAQARWLAAREDECAVSAAHLGLAHMPLDLLRHVASLAGLDGAPSFEQPASRFRSVWTSL